MLPVLLPVLLPLLSPILLPFEQTFELAWGAAEHDNPTPPGQFFTESNELHQTMKKLAKPRNTLSHQESETQETDIAPDSTRRALPPHCPTRRAMLPHYATRGGPRPTSRGAKPCATQFCGRRTTGGTDKVTRCKFPSYGRTLDGLVPESGCGGAHGACGALEKDTQYPAFANTTHYEPALTSFSKY